MNSSEASKTLVWDWPLRVWHWGLALAVSTALVTGYLGDIDLMDIHRYAGMTVVCLLVFRISWWIWGGTYSRFRWYRTTPRKFVRHFLGKNPTSAHTSPGIALAICLLATLLVQATAGLFATDDVFVEGPLVQFASEDVVEFATDLHHQVWWVVLGFISMHLLAHFVYGLVLRNPIALSMFTGKKSIEIEPATHTNLGAIVSVLIAVGVFTVLLAYSR